MKMGSGCIETMRSVRRRNGLLSASTNERNKLHFFIKAGGGNEIYLDARDSPFRCLLFILPSNASESSISYSRGIQLFHR